MGDISKDKQSSLFEVYLRLRPPPGVAHNPSASVGYPILPPPDRFLTVEDVSQDELKTHITLNPPVDNRRRAVEKFAFTRVFEESANQLDVFGGTGVLGLVEGVLGNVGGEGRDGLLATLGVTGSGKSHTILGSRSQRGLTQLALDVLFRSISSNILEPSTNTSLHATVAASDPSEAQVMSAQMFVDAMFNDPSASSRAGSRAPTPMIVRAPSSSLRAPSTYLTYKNLYPSLLGIEREMEGPKTPRAVPQNATYSAPLQRKELSTVEKSLEAKESTESQGNNRLWSTVSDTYLSSHMHSTLTKAVKFVNAKSLSKGESSYNLAPAPRRNLLQRPSVLPQMPDIGNVLVKADPNADYAVLISMYEVYNDRIFDLLTPALPGKSAKDFRRRPLLFKPTEQSPDRKVVAGLRKIICGTMKEALMVLEAGLHERRVAGTGSNSVSSRSHGFFCVEVKKRRRSRAPGPWSVSALTIVDLAGSERARDAKTQGATLAEAGKINESLMYLGQCLQMQSDIGSSAKPNLVPFRQCKLTELLFSNSFPSSSTTAPAASSHHYNHPQPHRNPQKAIMIVTADPVGDFNATSQILRYSALAREITVPRIPSVTSTILAQSTASHYFNPRYNNGGRTSPSETERETMEIAALEIARMSEEIDGLRAELIAEQQRRLESEAHLESMTDRILEVEEEIREECYSEMEKTMENEMRRWKATWAEEADRNDEHLDRKLEIYTRSIDASEENKENTAPSQRRIPPAKNEDLEAENQRLRREVESMRREMQSQSPTRGSRLPLRERDSGPSRDTLDVSREMERLHLGDMRDVAHDDDEIMEPVVLKSQSLGQSSTKKIKKLAARKWDLLDEGDDF